MLPFTIPIVICLVYWTIMIVGLLDIGIMDSMFSWLDGSADGAVEGAADGAADGLSDGLLDGTVDSVGSVEGGAGFIANFLTFLNFGHAPATIVVSFFAFFMWLCANIGRWMFPSIWATTTAALLGMFALVFAISFTVSAVLTHFSSKPFRCLMTIEHIPNQFGLIGKVCVITSRTVSTDFGQAEVSGGGSPIILRIVCEAENELKKGDKAVIVDYEDESDRYVVQPMF